MLWTALVMLTAFLKTYIVKIHVRNVPASIAFGSTYVLVRHVWVLFLDFCNLRLEWWLSHYNLIPLFDNTYLDKSVVSRYLSCTFLRHQLAWYNTSKRVFLQTFSGSFLFGHLEWDKLNFHREKKDVKEKDWFPQPLKWKYTVLHGTNTSTFHKSTNLSHDCPNKRLQQNIDSSEQIAPQPLHLMRNCSSLT